MLRKPLRANQAKMQVASGYSMPAPVGGWDAASPLAKMPEDRAVVLDNWFPQPGYVEVRNGYASYATGLGSSVVDTLMVYHGLTSAASKFFGAANNSIYDITTGGESSASVTGLTSNRWQYVNFTTSAGKYLWCCNGADDARHFNGSAWATPSLTINTYTSSDIIHVNVHKKRLWVIFKNSTVAGYLGTEAIAGAVTNFELGSHFTRGGYLVAMATWTIDGGDGVDDKAVFISSRGQCAVYVGTDPSSASTWALEGIYDLGPPIGRRCFTKVAGDVALVNLDGVLPLSRALGTDRGAVSQIAITARINNAMNSAARSYASNFGWELRPYQKGTMAILNVPIQEGQTQHQYVMNTLTGAWARFTNQNGNCWEVFQDNLYFGGNDGAVYRADYGSVDLDTYVDAIGQTAYSYFRSPGILKQFGMVQPIVVTDSDARPSVGISTDFRDNVSISTPSTSDVAVARYGTATYDNAIYPIEQRSIVDWGAVVGYGQAASIHFRAQTGPSYGMGLWGSGLWGSARWSEAQAGDIEVQINGFNVTLTRGAFI